MTQLIDLIQSPIAWPGIAVLLIWAAVEWWPRRSVSWYFHDRKGRQWWATTDALPNGYQPKSPYPIDDAKLTPPKGDMAVVSADVLDTEPVWVG